VTGPIVWTALQINAVGALYAGTNGSGVFISTDGGQSWQPDNNGNSDIDGADVVRRPVLERAQSEAAAISLRW